MSSPRDDYEQTSLDSREPRWGKKIRNKQVLPSWSWSYLCNVQASPKYRYGTLLIQTTPLKETKRFVFTLQLARLGVTEDCAGTTPYAELLGPEQKKEWAAHRAFVALFVASHRGHVETARFLLRHGNVLSQSDSPLAVLHSLPPSCLPRP